VTTGKKNRATVYKGTKRGLGTFKRTNKTKKIERHKNSTQNPFSSLGAIVQTIPLSKYIEETEKWILQVFFANIQKKCSISHGGIQKNIVCVR